MSDYYRNKLGVLTKKPQRKIKERTVYVIDWTDNINELGDFDNRSPAMYETWQQAASYLSRCSGSYNYYGIFKITIEEDME